MEITGKIGDSFHTITVDTNGFYVAAGIEEQSETDATHIYKGNNYLECVRAFLLQRNTGTLSSDIDLSNPKTLYYYNYANDSRLTFNVFKVVICNDYCNIEKVYYNKTQVWLDKFHLEKEAYFRKDIFDFMFKIELYLKLKM